MKRLLFAALLPALSLTAAAQAPQAPATAQQTSFQTSAQLIEKDGASRQVWIIAATKTSIRFRTAEVSADTEEVAISELDTIHLDEPREFSQAMDLYQGRKYEEAKAMFAEIKERFRPILQMENSHAALAAFYEMECMRKLGDLDGLNAALQKFVKDPLTRETHLRQIELYVLWDAVRTKSWDRLEILAKERVNVRLPGEQRAQVAYCHGLALEGLGRPDDALFAYSTAMTADAGASEEIGRQAALRVLAIHKSNPEVRNAMKVWGTTDENKNSKGHTNLLEAAAVAELFELSLGAGMPLPADFKDFLKYKSKTDG
jgi:tetratricopeptide (TPR) repeat protein